MPHEFIFFVFIQYFNEAIMSEVLPKMGGLENKGGMAIIGGSCPKKGEGSNLPYTIVLRS